ncbi:MAG TPA: hypothetical protein VNS88_13825, partial [Nitrospiraceae bacterium]|nr:hypothetical protein [Nitrospiraceae bacterium]
KIFVSKIGFGLKAPNHDRLNRANMRGTKHGIGAAPNTEGRDFECNGDLSVRREKALVHSGRQTRPGTGSLHPVTIGAAVEVTKPSEPPV